MVKRASDSPFGIVNAVRDVRARTEESMRRLGHGTPALRNSADHALELDSDSSVPRLVPQADGEPIGTTLRFGPDTVEVRSADDSENRDFVVRNLRVLGDLTATGLRVEGVASVRDRLAVDNGFTIGPIATSGKPFFYSPGDNVGIVASGGNLYVRNNFDSAYGAIYDSKAPASERALKVPLGPIKDALAVVEQWRAERWTWREGTPYSDDGQERAGVYVDEIADTAPEAVAGTDLDGNRIPDDRALIGYLVAAVQQLGRDNRELRAQIDALKAP